MSETTNRSSKYTQAESATWTDTEKSLYGIWKNILKTDQIGLNDNFFHLGGDPFCSLQANIQIREIFGVEIEPEVIMTFPILTELASHIDSVVNNTDINHSGKLRLKPVTRGSVAPLSYPQQRLWLAEQISPGGTSFNLSWVLRLKGNVNIHVLTEALQSITNRHESLRTSFEIRGAIPVQMVHEHISVDPVIVNVITAPDEDREETLQKLMKEEHLRLFDLSRPPLFRYRIYHTDENELYLHFTKHHIIFDGWSWSTWTDEFLTIYESLIKGISPDTVLKPLQLQYPDYSVYMRKELSKEHLNKSLSYWKDHLSGELPPLDLPTDRPRPPVQTSGGADFFFTIDEKLTASLREFCRREGVTLFQFLLGVYYILLYRYSGQTDLIVGSPVANRDHAALKPILGFFINMLPLRMEVDEDSSFRRLLSRVKSVSTAALRNRKVPFDMIVDELGISRDMSRHPVYQAGFTMRNYSEPRLDLSDLDVSIYDFDTGASLVDLTFIATPRKNTLSCIFNYNTDLFDPWRIEQMSDHFFRLIRGVLDQPEQKVIDIDYLSPEEKERLILTFNDTKANYPSEKTILTLFEEQVSRTPDSVAVVFENESLTYRELNHRANVIGHLLREKGVKAGQPVALLLDRNTHMIAGILGVLKSGGAYLPVDANAPDERIAFILEDSNASFVLAQKKFAERLIRLEVHNAIHMDEPDLFANAFSNPENVNRPDDMAYIIYTSGTTGKPKGVMVEHRNVVRLLFNDRNLFDFNERDAWTFFHSYFFDFSVWEMYGALLNGGKLVIVPQITAKSPSDYIRLLINERVTILNQTPGYFYRLMHEAIAMGKESEALPLRKVIFGGEALSPGLLADFRKKFPETQLINMYGITETTVHVTYKEITDREIESGISNIGKAIPTLQIYILDKKLQLCPVGVPGEICVGGEGVARGYINRPELTSEKFVENPFDPGSRLYRSGDSGRWTIHGDVEYLGRIDHQVKVRGYRIELGEIEAVLHESDSVRKCLVTAKESETLGKYLIAHVVVENRDILNEDRFRLSLQQQLEQHLKSKLPDYMIPSAFVFLEEFPLTPNGKVDRRALPDPDWSGTEEYVEAQTNEEKIIAEIWVEILEIDRAGRKDNFFDLGGHSLLATRLVSRIREKTGTVITMQSIFTNPVLKDMALLITDRAQELSDIPRVDRRQDLPLSLAQQRLWFIEEMVKGESPYQVPMSIRLYGSLDLDAFKESWNELIQRHESLRTRIENRNGTGFQIIEDDMDLPLEIRDLRKYETSNMEERVHELAKADVLRPFDLKTAPLFRIHLYRMEDDAHVLLVVMHHIITDGWSLEVLIRELFALYEAKANKNNKFALPEKRIDYVDFALWQRNHLSGEELNRQLSFWKENLNGELPVLELPTDRVRPPVQSYRGATVKFHIDSETTSWLRESARKDDGTLYMVLLAAYYILLYRYTGQEDIIVGSPIANRNRSELEGIVGFFVNTLPVRMQVNGELSFRDVLLRLRNAFPGAYDHQDIPFEKLVEELNVPRDMSRNPVFQTLFVLQIALIPELKSSSLRADRFELDSGLSHFDLIMSLEETGSEILGYLNYSTALFDQWRIRSMANHFLQLLKSIAENPERKIGELPILSADERNTLIEVWNRTERPLPMIPDATRTDGGREELFLDLFENKAREIPDRPAVICGEDTLSYHELNELSDRIAVALTNMGVRKNEFVGILMDRNHRAPAAMLGIWKAGCAYLPIDPTYPEERIAVMLEETGAPIVISQNPVLTEITANTNILSRLNILTVDSLAKIPEVDGKPISEKVKNLKSIDEYPKAKSLSRGTRSNDPAYIIYTSGTTGKPKGIINTHGNVSNLIHWTIHDLPVVENERVTQFASFSFDVSVAEFYPGLVRGGAIVILAGEERGSLFSYLDVLKNRKITWTSIPPALLYHLLDLMEGDPSRKSAFDSVQTVICGGDALLAREVERWQKLFGENPTILNVYGPTETTVLSTAHFVPVPVETERPVVSLGRPIDNTKVYILDKHDHPCPVSVVGEICISGAGVALGYINDPEKNRENFIANPFTNDGSRIYRTGDLGRRMPDGTIEFMGRADHQVKIRGFRIEIDEVEKTLQESEHVAKCIVLARDSETHGKYLAAYVIASDQLELNDTRKEELRKELENHIKSKLPEYMVPSAFVFMNDFPLTPNGKVDRKSLPEPDFTGGMEYDPPRSEQEISLARIWSEILGVEQIGRNDNFFQLGGHSLLATRLVSQIHDRNGVELPLHEVFANPVLEAMAAVMAGSVAKEKQSIRRMDHGGSLPLSFTQQRLWFIEEMNQENGSPYFIPIALRLTGDLNVDYLKLSLNEIVERHDSMRTRIVNIDGKGAQIIEGRIEPSLVIRDHRQIAPEDRENTLNRAVVEDSNQPFDLTMAPLFRTYLYMIDDHEYVFLFVMHHIISDGWSFGILFRELFTLYKAKVEGDATFSLPEKNIDYPDFSIWQKNFLSGEELDRQLAYWKENLSGNLPVLDLPADHIRPTVLSTKGGFIGLKLGAEITSWLTDIANREGGTLFMALLSMYYILLYRYTGQKDLIVGTPIANRNRAEVENIIGFFANNLAIRVELDGGMTFREIFQRVRTSTLGAYDHQDIPFEKLVEELNVERDMSRNPIFQTEFALQNAPVPEIEIPGLNTGRMDFDFGITHFDLTLNLEQMGDELHGYINYNTSLFDEWRIHAMIGHFTKIIERIRENPHAKIGSMDILLNQDRLYIRKMNDTDAPYPQNDTLMSLLEKSVQLHRDRPALIFQGNSITYDRLNRKVNQLARLLREKGVRRNELVGILCERSFEMLIAIYGIQKAGGGYLPMDPSNPDDRIQYVMEDSGARIVLAQNRFLHRIESDLIAIDLDDENTFRGDDSNPERVNEPNDLAYCIYTSGSTGKPKGVLLEHRNVVNTTDGLQELFPLLENDRFLFKTAYNFDVSVAEIFGWYYGGGSLFILTPGKEKDPQFIVDTIYENGITHVNFVPSMLQALVNALPLKEQKKLSVLKYVIQAGETFPASLARYFRENISGYLHLENLYGPTETTIYNTYYHIGPEVTESVLPVGNPIRNNRIHIVNADGAQQPIGVPGELYGAGLGVARGYQNRPELTAEKWVTPDWAPGERMYRTGDIARWRPDGYIEFVSRMDFQVKIRGFRIELGEIESVIGESDHVQECIVLARNNNVRGVFLAAYVVPVGIENFNETDQNGLRTELETRLIEKLPEYMVPQAFVFLHSFPLTANGKLDRTALPDPDFGGSETRTPPRTAEEKLLAMIWSEVLDIEEVGAHDNFFDLGGHSLLATQVVSRVREKSGAELPLMAIFSAPVLEDMAAMISITGEQESSIIHVSRNEPLPLSFAQQRLWFIEEMMKGEAPYHVPLTVRLKGKLDVEHFRQSLNDLVSRHESLRTKIENRDGTGVQIIEDRLEIPFIVNDLRNQDETDTEKRIAELVREGVHRAFRLSEAPLFRSYLHILRDDESVFQIVMHHIITDGWSLGILLKELFALYEAKRNGDDTFELPELPVDYADFAVWQREFLSGTELNRQLSHWKGVLSGELPVLELPADRVRPPVQSYEGSHVSFQLNDTQTGLLRDAARNADATLFMALMSIWFILLYRYTGQKDLIVGSPIANRNRKEIEGIIGFFVNTLAIRVPLDGEMTFRELLLRIKDILSVAYDHQDIPFEKLVEELHVERDTSRNPIFQSLFVLQNAPHSDLNLPDLSMEPYELDFGVSLFDVALSMEESGKTVLGYLNYSTALFDEWRMKAMADHFVRLTESIMANPGQSINDLAILTDEEFHTLTNRWNNTTRPIPMTGKTNQETLFLDLFEKIALEEPELPAVLFEDTILTYGELHRMAEQIAFALIDAGTKQNDFVGVLMNRDGRVIAAMLGIWKAGCAYIPIDPTYPEERIEVMLEETRASVILVENSALRGLSEHSSILHKKHILTLDSGIEDDTVATHPSTRNVRSFTSLKDQPVKTGKLPERIARIDDPAYVIYTSGTTGKPKGIVNTHGNLVNLSYWVTREFPLTRKDRVTQFASFSFDASVAEMFPPLTAGSSVVVLEQERRRSLTGYMELLKDKKITVSSIPPALLYQLIDIIESDPDMKTHFETVRMMICGGDALLAKQVERWQNLFGDSPSILNVYGPTETTVLSTAYRVPRPVDSDHPVVTLGGPIDNTRIYILDENSNLCPVSAVGEICIAGAGVAGGYLNDPDKNADKFGMDPFANDGSRMYKTGDLGRWMPDGKIEFMGRADHQVKIRGFRIEIDEVENVLQESDRIGKALVLAIQSEERGKYLAAYLVVNDTNDLVFERQAELRQELETLMKSKLPDYMVPSAFVFIEEFPLTPNGKVDRKALPDVEWNLSGEYVAPETEKEKILSEIWSDVLKLERVGVNDNFFEVGGDSILSIQIVSRAKSKNLKLTVAQIFEHKNIRNLARAVDFETDGFVEEEGYAVGEFSTGPVQQWFFEIPPVNPHRFNQSFLLELDRNTESEHLRRALDAIFAHHDLLRARYAIEGEAIKQIVPEEGGSFPFEEIDLRNRVLSEDEEHKYIHDQCEQMVRSFNIYEGRVCGAVHFVRDEKNLLYISIHHLVVDTVSLRILMEDLTRAMGMIRSGNEIALPPKTTSFRRWMEKLEDYARSPELSKEFDYWKRIVEKGSLPLPVDKPDGDNRVIHATESTAKLSASLTDRLLREVPAAYNTRINDILLAAVGSVLSRWIGHEDVLIEQEGHGREELFDNVDVSRTVGWFTSIYPVRLHMVPHMSHGELIKSVKEQLRAIPSNGIGYGILRYPGDDKISSDLVPQSAPEISFNYLGQFDTGKEDGEMRMASGKFSTPSDFGAENEGRHKLTMVASVFDGELSMRILYSSALFEKTTIDSLLERIMNQLNELIDHCVSQDAGGFTPSDFPLADLSQEETDRITSDPDVVDIYPMSPIQRGLLFHTLFEQGEGVYVTQLHWRLTGSLQVDAFVRSWQTILDRHEAMRASFLWNRDGSDLQIIRKNVAFPHEFFDRRNLSLEEQEKSFQELLVEDRRRGHNMAMGPMVRLYVIREEDNIHRIFISMHHIVMDGWCLGIVLQELFALYGAYAENRKVELPGVVSYKKYIEFLYAQDQDAAARYWKKALEGMDTPARLQLPSDPENRGEFKIIQRWLSVESSQAVGKFARSHNLTVNTIIQGALAVLIGRYAGEEDIAYGMVTSGRSAGMERIVGIMINTLPLRFDLSSDFNITEYLQDVQRRALEAREYENASLADIRSWTGMGGNESIFDIILAFENYPLDKAAMSELKGIIISDFEGTDRPNYGLTITVVEQEAISLQGNYHTSYISEMYAERFFQQFESIIEFILHHPAEKVGNISLLSSLDKEIIEKSNHTKADFPNQTLMELFEASVKRYTDRPALLLGDEMLTYDQLNRKANQLARILRGQGVGPETLVGILTERSFEMLIGIYGIQKAGAGYLPVDPTNPEDRIHYILKDSGAKAVVTQKKFAEKIEGEIPTIYLDDSEIYTGDDSDLANLANPSNLAYCIYTSGSTGKPKGVLLEHRGVVNMMDALQKMYPLQKDDRYLLKTAYTFDVSVTEIFGWFFEGGSLAILPPGGEKNPSVILDTVEKHMTTHINFAPSMLQVLLNSVHDEELKKLQILKYVFVAGEAFPPSLGRQFRRKVSRDIRLENIYGPTENTIYTTYFSVSRDGDEEIIPIGRPLQNGNTHIVSKTGQIQPVGATGELCASGVGVARGYLNRPELTEEKFVMSPFDPEVRIYRTGDLARMLPDGNIEYLGRIDHQVKIRGFRIEPGEIESRMEEHPAIREAVVIPKMDASGEYSLAAYYVVSGKTGIDSTELRSHLKKDLPDYMIPSYFIEVEEMPRTSSGKTDRKALQSIETNHNPTDIHVEAQNQVEENLVTIFQDVLKIHPVGVTDNFFDLGGDSLKAIRLTGKINDDLNANLNIADIFSHSTIRELSSLLKDTGDRLPDPEAVLQKLEEALTDVDGIKDSRILSRTIRDEFDNRYHSFDAYILPENLRILPAVLAGKAERLLKEKLSPEYLPNKLHIVNHLPETGDATNVEYDISKSKKSVDLKQGKIHEQMERILENGITHTRDYNVLRTYEPPAGQQFQLGHLGLTQDRNNAVYVRIDGVELSFIEAAVRSLIHRHDTLRTYVQQNEDDSFRFVEINSPNELSLPVIDLSQLEIEQIHHGTMQIGYDLVKPAFDLTRWPLFRIVLFKDSMRSYRLLWVFSHTISDGGGLNVIAQDLRKLCTSAPDAMARALPPLNGSYHDYVEEIQNQSRQLDFVDRREYLIEYFKTIDNLKPRMNVDGNAENKQADSWKWMKKLVNQDGDTPKTRVKTIRLNQEAMDRLHGNFPRHDLHDILLGVYVRACASWKKVERVPVGEVYHGRSYGEKHYFNLAGDLTDRLFILAKAEKDLESTIESIKESLRIMGHENYNQWSLFKRLVEEDPSYMEKGSYTPFQYNFVKLYHPETEKSSYEKWVELRYSLEASDSDAQLLKDQVSLEVHGDTDGLSLKIFSAGIAEQQIEELLSLIHRELDGATE